MKSFTIKLLLFLIPFLVLTALEVYIDPFNYFKSEKNTKLRDLKEHISQKNNPYLYRLIQYDRNPCSTIILGDSRTGLLLPALFETCAGETVSNLSIGGCSLQDMNEIFWYIIKRHNVKKVYMGISLETYNGILLRNRVKLIMEVKSSLLLYLFNKYTFSSTMYILRSILFHQEIDLYKPPFTKENFWQFQLEKSARYLENYSYPNNYYKELSEIAAHCWRNKIGLIFVISPTHSDLQKKIHDFNLENAYSKFKQDIESFGEVYDFNYPNSITLNRDNFVDPFHHNLTVSKLIVEEITGKNSIYSKHYQYVHKNKKPKAPLNKRL